MKPTILVLAISTALLTSCGSEAPRKVNAASSSRTVAVQTATAAIEQWPEICEATGTVQARTSATISSKAMGYVQQVSAQVGDRVRQGQTLVTLDAREFETGVRSAEAGRAEVAGTIPEAESATAAAKANLDLAAKTFERMETLAAQKSISRQEFDEARARVDAARANYEMARARRAQLDAKMAQAEQTIRSATIVRDYARITAPFAGVVTARSVEPGNLATPGATLFTIEQEGGYRLEAAVDESKMAVVKAGQPVEVELEAADRRVQARVAEIVPAVDAASRAMTVKIDLPGARQVRSGMFGRAIFQLPAHAVLTIPAAALVEHGQLESVFVVEDGAAHARLITVGSRGKNGVEVLSGLTAGERVVAPVPMGLEDDARVEARP